MRNCKTGAMELYRLRQDRKYDEILPGMRNGQTGEVGLYELWTKRKYDKILPGLWKAEKKCG